MTPRGEIAKPGPTTTNARSTRSSRSSAHPCSTSAPRSSSSSGDRRPAREAARGDGQQRLVGAAPGHRSARSRARRRDHHLAAHLLDRHRPHGAVRDRAGVRRHRPGHVPARRRPHRRADRRRTKAILTPNLCGNCPDWDAIRSVADEHGLQVVEDSCDVLDSWQRGTRTGTRSDISVTSFARTSDDRRRQRRPGRRRRPRPARPVPVATPLGAPVRAYLYGSRKGADRPLPRPADGTPTT